MYSKILITFAASAFLSACGGGGNDRPAIVSQLFAQTNDTSNSIVRFVRNADGSLVSKSNVKTGGHGTNGVNYFMGNIIAPDALTSNNSIILSTDKTRLFVANAGDNAVSSFSIDGITGDLTLLAVSPTGGVAPTSLAFLNGFLYVTHQRGAEQLGAYRVESDGKLASIGYYPVVQKDALVTQVDISPDGKFVVVNGFLKSVSPIVPANALLAFPILSNGGLGQSILSPSQGVGPFGGRFASGSLSSTYVVSEAAGTTVSSYALASNGIFKPTSGPVKISGQAAPCWVAITPNNKFVYISNGSGAISSFTLDDAGRISLANATAAAEPDVSAAASAFASDSWISPDGKFLYQDYSGADKIVVYSIAADGVLTKLSEQPARTLSKISLQGLVGT
jgi:6-phosphogluconolactonase